MEPKWILFIFVFMLLFTVALSSPFAKGNPMPSKLSAFWGKSFMGVQDPEYISYDQLLREHLVKRIGQRFHITLDPKKYSGFELLEMEALFRCKKSKETVDQILNMFPKGP